MSSKNYIEYKKGYKYQLAENYAIKVSIKPESNIKADFINLDINGSLKVKKGYAWDGTSGPVKDTKKNMRASLVHDALYQLMRNEELSTKKHRKIADQEFKKICIADGISKATATTYYQALRKLGKSAASPKNKKKIVRAPKKK